jgi:hypothetical protein
MMQELGPEMAGGFGWYGVNLQPCSSGATQAFPEMEQASAEFGTGFAVGTDFNSDDWLMF